MSVALMACSICVLLMPSIVVGIYVGKEEGWPLLVMVTTPRFLVGFSSWIASWIWANDDTQVLASEATSRDNGNFFKTFLQDTRRPSRACEGHADRKNGCVRRKLGVRVARRACEAT
jgi:hypothetical protein